ncbi:MCE family protein [Saccharopolyspora sp. NFXS83]|uniref:MCE family protein n=1 Tax=Saccharopolyspora sp. NFXS83 TaxID=2993560 RepID=UPI00224BA1A5|nr:MCE family protein [Saccharopolyspora sp. NFXS83]MCX2730484.1 MCE family protein [Saccharopolyspora sp. NFXS83]
MSRRPSRLIALGCAAALIIAGGWYVLLRPAPPRAVSADFATADGIYPGNKVHVLGVPVGVVEQVNPRGPVVRVVMRVRPDIALPAAAHAYIMSPQLISDRFVELGPAYGGGPVLADGAVIPAERAHSPIRWDELMSSLDAVVSALGPDGAGGGDDLGALLHSAATAADGNGPRVRTAITRLAGATDVLAGDREQLGELIGNLDVLVRALAEHRSTVDSLAAGVRQASEDYGGQRLHLDQTIGRLARSLAEADALIREHGGELTGSVRDLAGTTAQVAGQREQLSEVLTTLPLVFGNFSRAVTEDERLRIRLNISSNLAQFPATARLCERFPVPLCSGPGLVNPIPLPPNLDPLHTMVGGG